MNKEEIFEKFLPYDAMGVYAKQEAIGFGEWILKEHILARDTNWFDAGKHYTTEQLYQQYLKSKS